MTTKRVPQLGDKDYELKPWDLDFRNEPTITNQSDKEACDLNNIVRAYLRGQTILPPKEGVFADVSEMGDYREMRERLRAVGEYFQTLPAQVREKFGNDPANMVEAMSDPNQFQDLQQLGLFPVDDQLQDPPGGAPAASPAPPTGSGTTPQG